MKKQLYNINPYYQEKCPVIRALDIIGGKWRLAIIWELSRYKIMRYNELRRHLCGITNVMLTRSLQALEQHDLVTRKDYFQIPPHVEYSITESCKALLPALEIINEWGKTKSELSESKVKTTPVKQ
ncbi:winged helix-turn-helix transcriptional regulator [[Clostridium] fimetarium]|uniref:DNA-binding transcriptional regulator, HxlR family n=1 Tax=[Clostridium] fimetarium TaxID=99656 RepID=A0A1I0NHN1_9FIRM|nr:helix-turn-helix domain-containing protein [[Clostridium] fimetarium]SEW00308.1 DNA-binding transcriptional regulator, HxlR family [[Clostridium] fimetarium]